MTNALWYPGADRTSRWFGDAFDGLIQGVLDKLVLHSTETDKRWGCPGYQNGATAPTLTVNPWAGYRKVWQHLQANESARALLNPSSTPVAENKDRVAQLEIIGYSDVKLGKARGCYLPDLDDDGLQYVADIVRWYHVEWGIRLVAPPTWPYYQVSSAAAFADARMTSAEYDKYAGVLAHLHVSGNAHQDVAINIGKVLAFAGGEDDDMTPQERKQLIEDIRVAVWAGSEVTDTTGQKRKTGWALEAILNDGQRQNAALAALKAPDVAAIAAAVVAALPNTNATAEDIAKALVVELVKKSTEEPSA